MVLCQMEGTTLQPWIVRAMEAPKVQKGMETEMIKKIVHEHFAYGADPWSIEYKLARDETCRMDLGSVG